MGDRYDRAAPLTVYRYFLGDVTSADIDQMKAELNAAGWVSSRGGTQWTAPDGRRYVGPARAWQVMKGMTAP